MNQFRKASITVSATGIFFFAGLPVDGQPTATHNRSPSAVGDELFVAAQPRLKIEMSDTVDFAFLVGMFALPGRGVVLASHASNSLQYFDRQGRRTRVVGRKGRGPGEFEGIDKFFRFGDSLVVIDMQGVGQVYTLSGKFVRSEPALSSGDRLHGYFADGSRLTGTLKTDDIPVGKWQQATERLVRASAAQSTPLGSFPTQPLSRHANGQLLATVYSPRNRVAVFGRTFCAGYAGNASISCYDTKGVKRSTITLRNGSPVSVTKSDEDAYFNDVYVANPTDPKQMLDRQVAALRRRVTFSKSLGVFGPVLSGAGETIWVGPPSTADWRYLNPSPLPETQSVWQVYALNGDLIATVVLPARFFLFDAGRDYVAGVTKDQDGQEVVLIYDLRKRR